jgi:outer membrane receptor protein involved in Fe transport
MVFAEAARGFRYGGVNEPAPPQFCAADLNAIGLIASPATFGPDHLWSYTVGEKSTLGSGRYLLNVDGFFIDWQDVQTVHDLQCGYYFQENKGSITSQGLEWETSARLTHALTVGMSGSFTDARSKGPIANLDASDGDRAPYFPRTIITATADYTFDLPEGQIILGTDYTYRSNAYTQFSSTNPLYREIPSSRLLNATATYQRGRWSVGIFGTNLTNDRQISVVEPNLYAPYADARRASTHGVLGAKLNLRKFMFTNCLRARE